MVEVCVVSIRCYAESVSEYTFKELDQALGASKGTGFRRFKTILAELQENRDFRVLKSTTDATEIMALQASGRAYPQPAHIVLLSADCFERLRRLTWAT